MRVRREFALIEQNAPGHILNHGSVVFHAGANVASRWVDFQQFSEADREFFDQLLPIEELDFSSGDEIEVKPAPREFGNGGPFDVRGQTAIRLEEIPLIEEDPEALAALRVLRERGYSSDEVTQAYNELEPVPVTRVRQRQAIRSGLDMRVRTETGRILGERGVNPAGHDLDRQRLGRTSFIVLKTAIDRQVNTAVGRQSRERHEFTRQELDQIERDFAGIVERAVQEVFGAAN